MDITGSDASEAPIQPTDNLIDGFVPANLPPAAPDGGPMLEPAPIHLPILAEPLCDQGPCRHRHLIATEMEAGEPMDGSELERPRLDELGEPIIKGYQEDVTAWDGSIRKGLPIYETEAWRPRMVTRACYPAPGIKIDLGADEPVLECSRWDPEDPTDLEVIARERRREAYRALHPIPTVDPDLSGGDLDPESDQPPSSSGREKRRR